jgi:hypothetical protein
MCGASEGVIGFSWRYVAILAARVEPVLSVAGGADGVSTLHHNLRIALFRNP